MVTKPIAKKEEIEDIPAYANEGLKAELICYLSRHPNTRFDWKIVAHRIDWQRRSKIVQALEFLAEDGIVVKHACQGINLYSIFTKPE